MATLGADGKLDSSQIPSSISGAVVFKGSWDANANSPTLSNSLPAGLQAGWEYVVTTGATRDIGDGSQIFVAGDIVIYDGTHWKHIAAANNLTYATATVGSHVKVNDNYGTQETGVLTFTTDATPNATTATIVSRDASGNFSANVITANLTGAVTGSVSGNAGSVTNGVYTTGDQTIGGTKTFSNTIQGTITSATVAASVAGGIGVASLAGSSGTSVSASTGAVTVWFNTGTLVANAVNATTSTTAKTATTATNLTAATGILAGTLVAAVNVGKNSLTTLTYTITGLTTGHKIIITPATAMPDNAAFFGAAWASSANTVSIQFANGGNAGVNTTFNISYFAWV